MSDYKLSEETLNSLLQYLISRPYGEVAAHVAAIQQATPLPETREEFEARVDGELEKAKKEKK